MDEYYDIGDETFVLPAGFNFQPAQGKLHKDGSVTVSGHQFTQQEIQEAGKSWRGLIDVFKEIEASQLKDSGETSSSDS